MSSREKYRTSRYVYGRWEKRGARCYNDAGHPQPNDYWWQDSRITHYVNHAGMWVSAPAPGRYVYEIIGASYGTSYWKYPDGDKVLVPKGTNLYATQRLSGSSSMSAIPTLTDQIRTKRETIARLEEEITNLENRPTEPGALVISFSRSFTSPAGKIYNYAAIRADGMWYITGRGSADSCHGRTWDSLLEFITPTFWHTLKCWIVAQPIK